MSTKIYNGFKFNRSSFLQVRDLLNIFRKEIYNVSVDLLIDYHACSALQCFDYRCLGYKLDTDLDKTQSPIRAAHKFISDELIKCSNKDVNSFDHLYNLNVSITVFPVNRNLTLGCYFIKNDSLENLLLKQPWFIDYHYQNQSDRPDDITLKQWNIRSKMWDKALYISPVPSQAGFNIELNDSLFRYLYPIPEDIMSKIPSYSKRVIRHTKISVYEQYVKKNGKNGWISSHKFNKYLNSHNGILSTKRHEKIVRSKLKKNICKSDLYGKIVISSNSDYILKKK